MKKAILMALAFAMAACSTQLTDTVENRSFDKTGEYATVGFQVEVPVVENDATAKVRETLLDILHNEVVHLGFGEEPLPIKAYDNLNDSLAAIIGFYGENLHKHLEEQCKENELEDNDGEEEEFDELKDYDAPEWSCLCTLLRVSSTENYWVYMSENSVYYGGAHGYISGAGYPTFSKKDGSLITNIIDPARVDDMQMLLRDGLMEYMEVGDAELNDYLFLDKGFVPLPKHEPYPSPLEDGLTFYYEQYEIAPYAAGIPMFTIPFDKVKEFMTADAKAALGLE